MATKKKKHKETPPALRGQNKYLYKLTRHNKTAYNSTEEIDVYYKVIFNQSEMRNEFRVMVGDQVLDTFFDSGKARQMIADIVDQRVKNGWMILKSSV